ncbi:MAG: TIGR01777 family oxidoreductase [Pyrinomonadaceae bacterium]
MDSEKRSFVARDRRRAFMKVLIAGSSGLVGSAVTRSLAKKGAAVTHLVRTTPDPGKQEVEWHPNKGELDAADMEGFDAVINLGGESVAEGRWTEEKKKRIRDSRIQGTQLLSKTMAKLSAPPKVFLCASATGLYGDRGNEIVDESSPAGKGFLAGVCREWEEATQAATSAGIRVVNLRFGPIFSSEGGMLARLLPPFRLGVGGKIGSGDQYMSWVAMDDVVGVINFALEKDAVRGPLNVVTPNAVTNAEFTKALGKILSRPTFLMVPAFAARLAFGEMADEMLLASLRAVPKRLSEAGYTFKYPELEGALAGLIGPIRPIGPI